MKETLDALLRDARIWQGVVTAASPGMPTGCDALDAVLPARGWPTGALAEILIEHPGSGELALLMPALARMSRSDRLIVWVAPPFVPYAPALLHAGLDLRRLLVVRTESGGDVLWAGEQALRSGSCAAVLLWAEPSGRWLRRLQLAAEAGGALGVLYRSARARDQPTCAALRLCVWPDKLELLKCRGGAPRVLNAWRSH
jgi:protein ImuA